MAVANVIRVSLIGAMPNGEVWSINPVYQIGGVSTAEDITSEECLTMAQAVNGVAVPAGLLAYVGTTTTLTATRIEARRWNGELAAQAEAVRGSAVAGTGASSHPFQTSSVVSLRTGTPGATGRGRLYVPATGVPLSTSLRVAGGTVGSFIDGVRTYLVGIATALDVTLTNSPVLSVWSRLNESTAPVISIQVGDVLDTQRRRRDALIEAYTTRTYPT